MMQEYKTKVKICGITSVADNMIINKYRPDYVGFVFFDKSSRYVTPLRAVGLRAGIDPEIKSVGVFLNNTFELVKELIESEAVDILQFHGDEMGEEFIARVRDITDKPIIRAFSISDESDIEKARKSSADFVLLDSGNGGTGTTFDWNKIRDLDRPYFLAGGLDPENVADAVKRFHPFAVDVSSGVESNKRKDSEKVGAFIENARAAAGNLI